MDAHPGFAEHDSDGPGSWNERIATPEDAEAIAELLDAFNREFGVVTPGAAVLADRLRRLLAGPDMFALLSAEPAVGVALVSLRVNVWYDGPVALLDELYVAPDRRNLGIGTALLRAAETEARRRGADLLEINVDGEDVDARRFYARHGYACVEPGQTEPSLYYYKQLAPA